MVLGHDKQSCWEQWQVAASCGYEWQVAVTCRRGTSVVGNFKFLTLLRIKENQPTIIILTSKNCLTAILAYLNRYP